MKTYDDFIFERKLDEWLNSDEMIFERSYGGYSEGGFFGWLKRLGQKFWRWLTGKKYDEDDWWWDRNSKGLPIDKNNYKKFFDSNSNLKHKFPHSYNLSQKENSVFGVTVINKNKGFPACISFTDEIDDVIDILQSINKDKKWLNNVKKWVTDVFKNDDVIFIAKIEFAEDGAWEGCEESLCKIIYESIIENEDYDEEYKSVCIYIDGNKMLNSTFKEFINKPTAELIYDSNKKVIVFPIDKLKKYKNVKSSQSTAKPQPRNDASDNKNNEENTKPSKQNDNQKEPTKEEVNAQRKEEEKTLSEFETLDITSSENKPVAEVRYYTPKQVKDIFADKNGDKYRTLMKDYHGFEISPKKDDEEYIVFDIIKKNNIEEVGTGVISYILKNIAEHFASKQLTKDTRIYFLISKDKPEFDSIKKRVAEEDLKIKKYEFNDTNVVIKRRPLEASKNGASETNQVRFYFIAAKPKQEKTNESFCSLTSYIKNIQINETLDENIFYLLDTWFYNREDEKTAFMNIVSDCMNNKTYNKKDVEDLCIQYDIEIKPLVNFINQEINQSIKNNEIDYSYNMKQIIDAIIGNKSKSNIYIKNAYELK